MKVRIQRKLKVDDSSFIRHVGYDPNTRVLEVGLRYYLEDVTRYRYKKVPRTVFAGLVMAESMGTFFNTVIKPKYVAYRLPG